VARRMTAAALLTGSAALLAGPATVLAGSGTLLDSPTVLRSQHAALLEGRAALLFRHAALLPGCASLLAGCVRVLPGRVPGLPGRAALIERPAPQVVGRAQVAKARGWPRMPAHRSAPHFHDALHYRLTRPARSPAAGAPRACSGPALRRRPRPG